jgi:very-short-patch-repair endonuclease
MALAAAVARLPEGAAFSGRTAALLHGLDVAPRDLIEVTIPKGCGVSARSGMSVNRAQLEPGAVVFRQGMRTTSMVRTLLDIGQRLPLVEAVVIADMALHRRLVTSAQLSDAVLARAGARNVSRIRRMVELAEPASESPMETRLRLLRILAGLPRPQLQVDIYDGWGRFVARADLYYPSHRLVIEYDGGNHRDRLVEDDRRQNALVGAGYRILRFTAADLLGHPEAVIAQVRAALSRRQRPRS